MNKISINKKIKNATPTSFDGVKFKSELEARVYKLLRDSGFRPEYEAKKFVLSPKASPRVPFYAGVKGSLEINAKSVSPITYTPDFTFIYNDILIIIEVKGIPNDVYPLKKNLFRKLLEETYKDIPVMYFEIKTKRELIQAISIIQGETKPKMELRGYLSFMPDKYYSKAIKYLENKAYDKLQRLVTKIMSDDINFQKIIDCLTELKNEKKTL